MIDYIPKTMGGRLKQLRTEHGLTQDDVASKVGMGRTGYVKYETDTIKSPRKIKQLATLFNVSVDYLLCVSDIRSDNSRILNLYNQLSESSKLSINKLIERMYYLEQLKISK